MQIMDVEAFRARYPDWLEENRSLLEVANWKDAYKTYPFARHEDAPWTPMRKPLSECRVAMLSTAGLYVPGEQPPFNAEHYEGDWTLRELPDDVPVETMAIAHTHYDHARADQDRNCVYPRERLHELAAEGVIESVASLHYSISGYCSRADLLVEHTAPQVIQRLRMEGVDVLLQVPV